MTALAPRRPAAVALTLVAAALAAVVALTPTPFASEGPGPVLNTLGTAGAGGARLISISGTRTYKTSGALDLTTVSERGGPGDPLALPAVVRGWLSPTTAVLPRSELFDPSTSATADRLAGRAEMTGSQQAATAAALHELGIAVPTTVRVEATEAGTGARGSLARGDVIAAVDHVPVTDYTSLRGAVNGARTPSVVVTVLRSGVRRDVTVVLTRRGTGAVLGASVDLAYRFPFTVRIQVDRIGGPSAGTMFALGIIDELTPGAMTGGAHLAGTGTIDASGQVGPIGGIAAKMAGASAAGATAFLAPEANCADVVGHVPSGLQVVAVSTLHQARQAVEALGSGRGAHLAACHR